MRGEKRERRIAVEHQRAERVRFDADRRAAASRPAWKTPSPSADFEKNLDPRGDQFGRFQAVGAQRIGIRKRHAAHGPRDKRRVAAKIPEHFGHDDTRIVVHFAQPVAQKTLIGGALAQDRAFR